MHTVMELAEKTHQLTKNIFFNKGFYVIYNNFTYIMYIVIVIYIYLLALNVFFLVSVKIYRNDNYYKATTISHTYNIIMLGINYVLTIMFSVVLSTKYLFNIDIVFGDIYSMFIWIASIVYLNLYFLIAYAYQNTVYIKIEENELVKNNILWNKKIDLTGKITIKTVANHYIVKNEKKTIVFDRLKYDDNIDNIICEIEEITGDHFLKWK